MKLITGYKEFVNKLQGRMRSEEALEAAIGDGDFDAFGLLETDLLIDSGLTPDGYLIDVGCGSGRLAKPISHYLAQQSAVSSQQSAVSSQQSVDAIWALMSCLIWSNTPAN